ncbi:MAG: hypothetical protein K8823_525 [Cenarchaeum symbiont of Oopsacas minuta]|nr:hypothetical protein [Cenarchaeum symbiont of Oopsacas minuta]
MKLYNMLILKTQLHYKYTTPFVPVVVMFFSEITNTLQAHLRSNMPQIRIVLKKNPAMAYSLITEIGSNVGKIYGVKIVVNFPGEGRIEEFDMYGKRDLSIIIDQSKTRFPIEREQIKRTAQEIISDAKTEDAYMYEGKEGVKVFHRGGRIDILPHSLHVWCEFTLKVTKYCDWLMKNVYLLSRTVK